MRAAAISRWRASASPYGMRPADTTHSSRGIVMVNRTEHAAASGRVACDRVPGTPSRVNHLPERIERRLGDCLGEGRVRVDRQVDFLDGELVLAGHAQLVNQLRGVRPDDMRAEDLAILRIADDLHEALGVARRPRAAIVREGKPSNLVVQLLLLALLLRQDRKSVV